MPCGHGPQNVPLGFFSIPWLGLLQLFQVYREHAWETWGSRVSGSGRRSLAMMLCAPARSLWYALCSTSALARLKHWGSVHFQVG